MLASPCALWGGAKGWHRGYAQSATRPHSFLVCRGTYDARGTVEISGPIARHSLFEASRLRCHNLVRRRLLSPRTSDTMHRIYFVLGPARATSVDSLSRASDFISDNVCPRGFVPAIHCGSGASHLSSSQQINCAKRQQGPAIRTSFMSRHVKNQRIFIAFRLRVWPLRVRGLRGMCGAATICGRDFRSRTGMLTLRLDLKALRTTLREIFLLRSTAKVPLHDLRGGNGRTNCSSPTTVALLHGACLVATMKEAEGFNGRR